MPNAQLSYDVSMLTSNGLTSRNVWNLFSCTLSDNRGLLLKSSFNMLNDVQLKSNKL